MFYKLLLIHIFHTIKNISIFKCSVTRNCAYAVDFADLWTHTYSWSFIYLLTMFYFVSQFLAKSSLKTCRLNAPMLILVHGKICLQIEMKDDHYQSHRCTRRVKIKFCIVLVVAETTAEKSNTNSNKILFSLNTGRFADTYPKYFDQIFRFCNLCFSKCRKH